MLAIPLALLALAGLASAADLVPLPGSEVKLPAEDGFLVETRWVGVANFKTQASLMITTMDVGADKMVTQLTPEALAPQGVKVTSSEPVRIGDYDGVWMEGTQEGGRVWIALVGDPARTWLFKGSAPSKGAGAAVVRMVQGATWGEMVPPSLGFDLDAPFGLVHAGDVSGSRLFTTDGVMGEATGKTLYVVAPAIRPLPVSEDSARALFVTIAGLEDVILERTVPVTHGERTGWDLRGRGIDATTKAPMGTWQRILFTPDGLYLRIVAVSPLAERDMWLPHWVKAADTLR